MRSPSYAQRLPAEWEAQDAVLLAWPHKKTDWSSILDQAQAVYLEITRQIIRFEAVVIVSPEPDSVRQQLQGAGVNLSRITVLDIDTNDTWARDFGPLCVQTASGIRILDFAFNGWGEKFPAEKDNRVTSEICALKFFNPEKRQTVQLTLEGGSIEVDGRGTLLTTSQCLLNPNRNPELKRFQLEEQLSEHLGIDNFLWLDHGYLAGDDTDSHIDTLARLCPDDTIIFMACADEEDEHFYELKKMEAQLTSFKTPAGTPFRLLPLPWPQPVYDEEQRLPATYANFLVINQAVLVPTYNDPADTEALQQISIAYPDRDVIGIDCRPLIKQHGSLHCISMQLPQGILT